MRPARRRSSPQGSSVLPVVARAGRGRSARLELGQPLGTKLLDVLGAAGQPVDPVGQPGVGRRRITTDWIPIAIEAVVAVVGALYVRRMGAPWFDHDRVHDQARD